MIDSVDAKSVFRTIVVEHCCCPNSVSRHTCPAFHDARYGLRGEEVEPPAVPADDELGDLLDAVAEAPAAPKVEAPSALGAAEGVLPRFRSGRRVFKRGFGRLTLTTKPSNGTINPSPRNRLMLP